MSYNIPILFLVFNRPHHTKLTFRQIKKIKPRKLYVAADGPRKNNSDDKNKCEKVKKIISSTIDWDCELITLYRKSNLGCGKAVSEAITWFFEHEEMGVILEDDILPDISFFEFCRHCLITYKNDKKILSIKGTHLLENSVDTSYYFSKFGGIWGWATWRRAWNMYEYNPKYNSKVFYDHFKNKTIAKFYTDFYKSEEIKRDTWDHQWIYTIFKNKGLTIEPAINLVENIGFGLDSTHTSTTNFSFKSKQIEFPLKIPKNIKSNKKLDFEYFIKRKLSQPNIAFREKVIFIYKKYLAQKIYVFGDSHAEIFKYINQKYPFILKKFIVTFVGGATAQGLRNPNSKTNALDIFKKKIDAISNKKAKLFFQLGEVDTGFVIWYRAQKYNEPVEKQLNDSIDTYLEFLKKIKNKGFKNIYVLSAPLPTIKDGQDWGEVANLRKEISASQLERTNLTLEYNKKIKQLCSENRINFISTDDELLDSKANCIKSSFLNKDKNNHHLDEELYSKIILQKIPF